MKGNQPTEYKIPEFQFIEMRHFQISIVKTLEVFQANVAENSNNLYYFFKQ